MKKIFSMLTAMMITASAMALTGNVTVTFANGEYSDTDKKITWSEVGGNIKMYQLAGTSSSSFGTYYATPRVYKGNILLFEALNGYKIDSVKMQFDKSNCGNSMTAGIAIVDNKTVTDNTTAVARDFQYKSGGTHSLYASDSKGLEKIYLQNVAATNVQLRPTAVTIYYQKESGSNPEIVAADYDFKAQPRGVEGVQTIVSVAGVNLTEAISYSMKDDVVFHASGTLTKTGGNLTITVDASQAGIFSDTIILTANGVTQKVALDINILATEGNGTKEDPFTPADVVLLDSRYTVKSWVEGIIIGFVSDNKVVVGVEGAAVSNLVIAFDTDTLPVELPTGALRTALNLKDHPENLNATLNVFGKMEAYFQRPGVKGISDYVLTPYTPSALETNKMNADIDKNFENGRLVIIRKGVKYDATGTVIE